MPEHFDAVVVGGGHNGLVAAGYLARAGLKVVVLERRGVVGGPCSTVEFFPGFRGAITHSPGSLEPGIVRDLELEKHGLSWVRPDPTMVQPFPGGRGFVGWRDQARVVEQLRGFSERDVVAYYQLFEDLNAFGRTLGVSLFKPPSTIRELVRNLETPEDEEMFAKIVLGSIKDLLDERFESDEVKAIIASTGTNVLRPPSTPGSPWMMMWRPLSLASASVTAADDPRLQVLRGSTGLPMGAMGAITQAMQRFIESRGGTVRIGCEVERLLTRDGRAYGVVLRGGEEVHGSVVLSNLNPRTTFLRLAPNEDLDEGFRQKVARIPMRPGMFRVSLALDGLPRFANAKTDEEARQLAGCQFRIAPSMEYIERAYDDFKYGRPSESPLIWGLVPSVHDPALAPPGKHFMGLNVLYAPVELRQGSWATERDRFGKRTIDVLAEFIPNLRDIIIDHRFFSPADLEQELGMLGGSATQGEMLPGNLFSLRPVPGWSRYRTPIRGLYLCGSGAWPGGFVSGLPGFNASYQVLEDLKEEHVA